MISVFFDSNIWLRLYLADQKEQYQSILELISYTDKGFFRPYTSTIVFLEVNYVLRSYYRLPHEKTHTYLEKMKETRNITIIDATNLNQALEYYKTYKIKFTDCLIASQLPKNIILTTFDLEFKKIKEINCQTPKELLATLSTAN